MANFQYKTASGATFADVGKYAYQGTYSGTLEIVSPPADDRDGEGKPCGAIGKPRMVMRSGIMSACGMEFWQGLFSASTSTYTNLWIKAYNPRTLGWYTGSGYLTRPRWSRIQLGSACTNTMYYDVEIVIEELRDSS